MSKVLAIDLDGTLLDHQNNIIGGEVTLNLFKELHSLGVELVINTGRLDHDIDYICNKYSLPVDVKISQNGAVFNNLESVKANILDKQQALQFYEMIQSYDIRCELNTISNRYWHSLRSPDFPKEFYDSSKIVSDFRDVIQYQPCVLFLLIGDDTVLEKVRHIVVENFDKLEAVKTSNTSLEVLVKGTSKGQTLSEAFEHYDIFAIGDSENDHSMFDYAIQSYYVSDESHPNAIRVSSIVDALQNIIKTLNNGR